MAGSDASLIPDWPAPAQVAPTLPAISVILAETLNVPSPCAAMVAGGTVTVALPPRMSAASSV